MGIWNSITIWAIVQQFSKELNMLLPFDQGIPLPGIYLLMINDKIYVCTWTCTWIFTSSLFTIDKSLSKSVCSSNGEWLNKLYPYTVVYHLGIKKNELLMQATTLMSLKIIVQRERSQIIKNTSCSITLK